MPSLVTDNFRIFASQQFVESLEEPYTNAPTPPTLPTPTSEDPTNTSENALSRAYRSKLYLFIGRSFNWNDTTTSGAVKEKYKDNSSVTELTPPPPVDSIDELNEIYDDMISIKRVTRSDVCEVIRKRIWQKDIVYDMYRPDYGTINADNTVKLSSNGQSKLFDCNFYVMNSQFQVYKCIYNGQTPSNPNGVPSTVEPTGTSTSIIGDGVTGDKYRWKYMYTISIPDYLKFVSADFMPVRIDSTVKAAAVNGSIQQVVVRNAGTGFTSTDAGTYYIPVKGDGGRDDNGTVNNSKKCVIAITVTQSGGVTSAVIANQNSTVYSGEGYTYGYADFAKCYTTIDNALNETTGTTTFKDFSSKNSSLEVIISPPGGHGSNAIYEFGAYRIMINKSLDFLDGEGDIPIDIQFRRFGLIEDPQTTGNQDIVSPTATVCKAIKFPSTMTTNFVNGEIITQATTGATGRVIHWDPIDKILRYYQNQYISDEKQTGVSKYKYIPFSGANAITGSDTDKGGSGITATPDTSYTNTVQNPEIAGIQFTSGYSTSEIKKFSGNILYIENRKPVIRSNDQIEDIKLVIEF